MKRAVLVVGLIVLAAPAAAQWIGMPAWNSPKGGTGVGFYADYGEPNQDAGKGDAFGGRASLGAGTVTLTAGVSSWKPENVNARVTSVAGTAAFRLIGGSLLPVAVNLQLGGAYSAKVTSGTQTVSPQTTIAQGAVGFSVPLPTPIISIEPYFSPGVRYHKYWNVPAGATTHETNFGWAVGGTLGFGMVGVHLAYDSEKFSGSTHGVFGVGAHVSLNVPLGM